MRVERTNWGGFMAERWEVKRVRQGAVGRDFVDGVVVDMVRRRWVRRVVAMVAGVGGILVCEVFGDGIEGIGSEKFIEA